MRKLPRNNCHVNTCEPDNILAIAKSPIADRLYSRSTTASIAGGDCMSRIKTNLVIFPAIENDNRTREWLYCRSFAVNRGISNLVIFFSRGTGNGRE
jgi:hypothetical protein